MFTELSLLDLPEGREYCKMAFDSSVTTLGPEALT